MFALNSQAITGKILILESRLKQRDVLTIVNKINILRPLCLRLIYSDKHGGTAYRLPFRCLIIRVFDF